MADMTEMPVVREGFVAVVNRKDGTIAYLTSHDGLYGDREYLNSMPDNEHIHELVNNAMNDVLTIKEFMQDFYQNEFDLDSARVVRYFEQAKIEEIDNFDLEKIAKEAEYAKAIKDAEAKLTTEECDLLYKHWSQIDKELGK